jgi:hypothetical protein
VQLNQKQANICDLPKSYTKNYSIHAQRYEIAALLQNEENRIDWLIVDFFGYDLHESRFSTSRKAAFNIEIS